MKLHPLVSFSRFVKRLKCTNPRIWCILACLICYSLIVFLTALFFVIDLFSYLPTNMLDGIKSAWSDITSNAKYNIGHIKRITPDIVKTWKGCDK